MKDLWDKRYSGTDYVYGKQANRFLMDSMDKIKDRSSILFPAEGEGRNAVHAASIGHLAFAFDISRTGRDKAMKLAEEEGVRIQYLLGELDSLDLKAESFDAVVLIFAHFPPGQRQHLHRSLEKLLKPGGLVVLEGFSVNNLAYRQQHPGIGGPDREDMLFTPEMIAGDFEGFTIDLLEESETTLQEGSQHNGHAKVVRFLGTKPGT